MSFPPVPQSIKSIAHVLKVADEHDNRNVVVSYWARMYGCQTAMKLIPGKKPPDVSALLISLMDWLEQAKKSNSEVEGITSETVAQALIEEYAMQLFNYADGQDRSGNFNKNMIKSFYTAGILMDVLEQFGEQPDDIAERKKYAKWKAAYIHNCLKSGETPTSGGPNDHLKNVIDMNRDEGEEPTDDDLIMPPREQMPPFGKDSPAPAPSPVTPADPQAFVAAPSTTSSGTIVNPETIQKAQKFSKYAISALNYDDVKSAVENLTKALNLLQTGSE